MNKILLPLASVLILSACDTSKEIIEEVVTETVETVGTSASSQTIDLDYLNTSIAPQDDFFEFSNGTWLKENPVPASESTWGSFNELDQNNKKKLTTLLKEAKTIGGAQGTMNQILGDYYSAFMNMDLRNEVGIKAISGDLELIENISSKKQLPSIIAEHHNVGIGSLFGFGVGQDLMDIDNNAVYFGQGGIGLPNKDYYSAEDKADILQKYEVHITIMMQILGESIKNSQKIASSVVDFETQLASAMMSRSEMRAPEKTYNKFSANSLYEELGLFNMEQYIGSIGIAAFDTVIVGQPDYLKKISSMIDNVELSDWKNYLKWKTLDHYAGHLNENLVNQNFEFYGKVLTGKSEMKPINDRAIEEITNQVFAELLGKAFVGRHYSDVAAQRVNTMVDNLLIVFEERINNLEWMTPTTKEQALIKLKSIGRKIGFPNVWEDFSALNFKADSYIGNIKEASRFAQKQNLAKLHEPVNKDEWGMPAHMVNAYYHPLLNEIAFPAGIMQAPFFSEKYEDAVNYGRIGMVIGHEFTHGFDDMGSKFAADGSFTNWWSAEDRTAFEKRTGKLGVTFEGFCPIDGHCVNSSLTMGENIADLGGLTMAYYAYTRTAEFKSGIHRKGYTPAQRFFISYAQLWKINYTQEELKNRIANDSHSPGMYRVNGPLMNCPEFFEAFSVRPENAMRNQEDKISKIW